ncbi:MAG: hypothetical protein IJN16_07820 [Lachnospiraceae bacterium]|nr:hypothetical protein [Lachnospiraceae bacterium]
MMNVIMEGTGIYIPPNKVYNEELDEHFEKRGLSAHSLMQHLGRRKRYFISEDENTITMSQNAINNCIQKNHLNLNEYEMLVVCSDTPEFLSPSNAIRITGLYGEDMKNIKIAFDLNSNCTGMLQGMDLVSKYMKLSNIKKALVVGCFCITPATLWSDTVVYATFADAAACVALSLEEADKPRGLMDAYTFVDASYHQYVVYPKCGMSRVPLKMVEPNEKRLEWNSFPMDFLAGKWADAIQDVLRRNSLTTDDIQHFIFSQLSDAYNTATLNLLGISPDDNRYHFLGKEYGYTGNTCPILCLNRMWDMYCQPGNRIILCTVGAGYSIIVLLYQF